MARGYSDDEDESALPWLEPAEPEDDDEGGGGFPYRGLIVAGVAIVAIVAVLWFVAEWLAGGRGSDSVAAVDDVPLIQAPEGPYKVRPDNPGGLDVDAGSLTHSVAEGQDPDSALALDVIPEEPVPVISAPAVKTPPVRSAEVPAPGALPAQTAAPKAPPATKVVEKAPAPKPEVKTPVVEKTPEKPVIKETPKPVANGNVTVQLGAFNSTASADQVWSKLTGRVGALGGLRKTVQPVETGGKTLYRLRAGGIASEAQAGSVCAAVQAAGEQCVIVR